MSSDPTTEALIERLERAEQQRKEAEQQRKEAEQLAEQERRERQKAEKRAEGAEQRAEGAEQRAEGAERQVYELTRTRQSTPPAAVPSQIAHTPLRPSSSSQKGLDQDHPEIDQRIIEELHDRVYNDVEEFFDRFFEAQQWSPKATEIFNRSKDRHKDGRWMEWPQNNLEPDVLNWLDDFLVKSLKGLGRAYYSSTQYYLLGSERGRKLDHFLAPATMKSDKYDWSSVLVVGELKSNPVKDGRTPSLVQLAGYAREVFGAQPGRRFVHGYTLCGDQMRLYLFDRSGAFSSPEFNIHKHPDRFVKALAGYALMSDEELGLNTFIRHDLSGPYVRVKKSKIYLDERPIASQNGIVCRGTTCFKGKEADMDWSCVVKFSWPSVRRRDEGELLKLAKDRGVKGVAEWIDHQDISISGRPDTISNLRKGLRFSKLGRILRKAAWVDGSMEDSGAAPRSSLRDALRKKASISNSRASSSSRKRKSEPEDEDSSPTKKTRSSDTSEERSPYTNLTDPQPDSLMSDDEELYCDRVHRCLVVAPAGRPIYEFESLKELLTALRDAIQAHKSLWKEGKILHRDISDNNIVIAKNENGESIGVLIDLDLAKEEGSSLSGARHRTGTMQFMAIEVLAGISHTYRHDLEAFFYVLLWVCIRHQRGNAIADDPGSSQVSTFIRREEQRNSVLRKWYTGNFRDIWICKRATMEKGGFRTVLAEFSSLFVEVKPLAEKVRAILFPISADGEIFTGTPPAKDGEKIYDRIISAFDGAIQELE